MIVWKGVVLRFLVSSMLPLTILWIHGEADLKWPLLLLGLMSFWSITDAIGRVPGHTRRVLQNITIPIFILFAIYIFFQYVNNSDSKRWLSHMGGEVLLFFNFKKIFDTLQVEYIACCAFFSNCIQFTYRWKYVKVIIYLVCLSFLVCFAVDLVFNVFLNITQRKDCGYKSTGGSWLEYRHPFNKRDYEFEYRQIHLKGFIRGQHKTVLVLENDTTLSTKYWTSTYNRYIGEDIRIICLMPVFLNSAMTSPDYFFLHNGDRVSPSDRHLLNKTYLNDYNEITITLDIFFIQESDFGLYDCAYQYVQEASVIVCYPYRPCETHFGISVSSGVFEKFNLIQMSSVVEVIYLDRYDKVKFTSDLETLPTMETAVSYKYSINNDELDEQLLKLQQCAIQVQMLKMLRTLLSDPYEMLRYLHQPDLACDNTMTKNDQMVYATSVNLCAQPRIYGWHKMSFLREHFNRAKNRTELLEFQIPVTRFIWPEPKRRILWYLFDDSSQYEELKREMLETGPNNISKTSLSLLHSNEEKVQKFDEAVTIIFIVSLILGFIKVVTLVLGVFYRLCILFVVNRIIDRDIMRALRDNISDENDIDLRVYDIFITYSEEDYQWVSTSLVPYLERDLGLSVCFPDRDFHQGENTIRSVNTAMCTSKKVIVVLTPDYMANRGCYALQVEHLLLPSLYEGDRNTLSVLLLHLEICKIPRPLRWNFDIKCIKWYNYPENESRMQLERWVKQE